MDWNDEIQERFDTLRERELAGALTNAEKQELLAFMNQLTQEADAALSGSIDQLDKTQIALEQQLQQRQQENEALALLLNQQQQLKTELRQWLVEFDQRQARIRETYTRLTGDVLPST